MLSYDRRAPEPLMGALRSGGWAESLVDYGRSGQYSMDLQLHGYPKREHWASLYVGLTKVLDLCYVESKGFRLKGHPTYKKAGSWNPRWDNYVRWGLDRSDWREVEHYLDRVVPAVGNRFLNEGAVQSALSAFQLRRLTVIDREAAVTFATESEKRRVTKELVQPILDAVEPTAGDPDWWNGRPKSLGTECGALAVDADGRLLVIELKPSNAATIPWAPVHVRHYADLFERWASTTTRASEIINGMLYQRAELGLTPHGNPVCANPVDVRPVLAVPEGLGKTYQSRLLEVNRRLGNVASGTSAVELYVVNLVGRLDPLEP